METSETPLTPTGRKTEYKHVIKGKIDELFRLIHKADVVEIDEQYLVKLDRVMDILIARFRTWQPRK